MYWNNFFLCIYKLRSDCINIISINKNEKISLLELKKKNLIKWGILIILFPICSIRVKWVFSQKKLFSFIIIDLIPLC